MGLYHKLGGRPVHLLHIRKTGGTSINFSFLALAGGDPRAVWLKMREDGVEVFNVGRFRFVTRNKELIEAGAYTYSHAHLPRHELDLGPEVFTVCSIRDPVDRLCSHYRMVSEYVELGVKKSWLDRESQWLGEGVVDFCRNMPVERRQAQLYCFSHSGNVAEATEVASRVSFLFNFAKFEESLMCLGKELGVNLKNFHERRTVQQDVSQYERDALADALYEELRLFESLRQQFCC